MSSSINYKRNPVDDRTVTSETTDSSQTVFDENVQLQEVMRDNLELMLEIIMKVREDENFARSVYADCPRLQHLLDQHPDLRPIFEDPKIVRINFEHVYRQAGGRLPEDKYTLFQKVTDTVKKTATTVVNHPAFQVFQFLLFLKKIYTCIVGFGPNVLRTISSTIFSNGEYRPGDYRPSEDALEDKIENAGSEAQTDLQKDTLFKAADHMDDPDVRQQMNMLLDSDPDRLDEAIESDPELRMLRESNPLCAELMSDPSTMKILVDPDNLRALAGCPELIELDFADPNWKPDPFESVPFDESSSTNAAANPTLSAPLPESNLDVLEEMELEGDDEHEGANKKQQEESKEEEGQEGQSGGGGGAGGYGMAMGMGMGLVGMATGGMFTIPGSELWTGLGGGGDDLGLGAIEEAADAVSEKASEQNNQEEQGEGSADSQ